MNSKNKNNRDLYRGINSFKRGYSAIYKLMKSENGDLLAEAHILNMLEELLFSVTECA
jgi:hypothetical protein